MSKRFLIYFCTETMWGLPFDLLNEEAAWDIGKGLETVVAIDKTAFASEQASFLRIRVDIPVSLPLRRGDPVISSEGDRVWIAFKYERINGLCFSCGRLGHEMKTCCYLNPETMGDETPYGEWMKAGGRRRAKDEDHLASSPPRRQPAESTDTGAVFNRARTNVLAGREETNHGRNPVLDIIHKDTQNPSQILP
ncbi:uncharacterized protein At4g02000-like [Quercus robur]|uniref:uncharacterized protein At4g02000-like n=1 Tax=Quercus robur TaxID=38942 RepID=UPI0021637A1D|nr:uncharacterized protein At4g02000-like [Quercus robur]